MARRERALSDAPGGAESVAERAPKSRGVAWLGFAALLSLTALFAYTALEKKPVNVPHGLLGLRFGMSEQEAREALPGLAAAPDGELRIATRVFEAPARCQLGFAESELSRVDCELDPAADQAEHDRLERRVLATVRQLYGDESDWTPGPRKRWTWQSSRATLHVISEGRALRIENVSASD